MLAGLDCDAAWAADFLGWDESFVLFARVTVSCAALEQSAEGFPVRREESLRGF